MIKIGVYDELRLRLNSLDRLLKTFDDVEVSFKSYKPSKLIEFATSHCPDIILMNASVIDDEFEDLMHKVNCLKTDAKLMVITTKVSKWLIPNMQKMDILGYLVMSTKPSNLIDAIEAVSDGKTYCCNEVSRAVLQTQSFMVPEFNEREKEIIHLIIQDKSTKEIASEMCLSMHTIASYRKKILRKFNVSSCTGMVKKALDAGLG